MDTKQLIAHLDEEGNVQTVREHLLGTAEMAKKFAEVFGGGNAAWLCGLYHDIGKCSKAFQERIRNPMSAGRVDHSTAGAVELQKINPHFIPLAMAVAGHHSGLMDGGNSMVAEDGTFFGRCKKRLEDYSDWRREKLPEGIGGMEEIFPDFCTKSAYEMSFFIRMIFSCLVDADYLNTESFMKHDRVMRGGYDSLTGLLQRFEKYVSGWFMKEPEGGERNAELC